MSITITHARDTEGITDSLKNAYHAVGSVKNGIVRNIRRNHSGMHRIWNSDSDTFWAGGVGGAITAPVGLPAILMGNKNAEQFNNNHCAKVITSKENRKAWTEKEIADCKAPYEQAVFGRAYKSGDLAQREEIDEAYKVRCFQKTQAEKDESYKLFCKVFKEQKTSMFDDIKNAEEKKLNEKK